MGGHLNVVGVRSTIYSCLAKRKIDASKLDPWYFPTPSSYSKLLEQVGLRPTVAYLFPRPTPLPRQSGLLGWLEVRSRILFLHSLFIDQSSSFSFLLICPQIFAGPFVNALSSESDRKQLLEEVKDQVKIDMYDSDSDQWTLMCEY